MKDSFRRRFSRAVSPSASPEGDIVFTNSWAETPSEKENGISRQVSTTSAKTEAAESPTKVAFARKLSEFQGFAPHLELPTDGSPTSIKAMRRRKTVTKIPGTFELEEEIIEAKGSDTSSSTGDPKHVVCGPPQDQGPPNAATGASFSFSNVTTTLDIRPVEPSEPVPRQSQAVQSPFSTPSYHHRKSSSRVNGVPHTSNPCRFTPPMPHVDNFFNKVIVLTQGTSAVGSSLVQHFHAVGARVIFGDTNADRAKRQIASLGAPHIVHFNHCDVARYDDILDLFKLAMTMYGRVDHAIFGVGDDGGQIGTVADMERQGWFDYGNKTSKAVMEEVQTEHPHPSSGGGHNMEDTICASMKFARIALAYLRHFPNPQSRRKSRPSGGGEGHSHSASIDSTFGLGSGVKRDDRSLTFLTSVAAFKETPGLPFYQVAQHGILGLVRSLKASINPAVDGVRINAVATNMMVPRATAQAGGRVSVQIPPDNPEDVARAVAGVVAAAAAAAAAAVAPPAGGEGAEESGIWFEGGGGAAATEDEGGPKHNPSSSTTLVHGRTLYLAGGGGACWDIQEGLDRSEDVWLGSLPAELLAKAQQGVGDGSQWILEFA